MMEVRTSKNHKRRMLAKSKNLFFSEFWKLKAWNNPRNNLFKKNSWISENQALCLFHFPLFRAPPLKSMIATKTNSLATIVAVKTSTPAATGGAE